MTDVTIRGIDDEVYARFAAEAKKRGVPIGELTTMVMRNLVDEERKPSYRIGNLEDLSVSKTDLESMDAPVVFANIETLEFESDVDWPVFKAQVQSIDNVETVKVPRSLSKFQVLTKSRNVEEVVSSGK
jgi:hypothetical protein